jgi:GT2 family glycosyltransferase
VIPVLGIPVLTRPDLLRSCLSSIDVPVGSLVIIDNSPEGDIGDFALDAVPSLVDRVTVTVPPANLGYPASVNLVIKTAPDAPWWAVSNADVVFGSGDLERLAAAMADPAPRWVGIIDWRTFGLNAAAVDAAGFWDENFHPAFCEDADYEWRCHLAGVHTEFLTGTTSHVGSVTLGEPRYAQGNARSYPSNRAYYRAKWGGELRGGEAFSTPFAAGGSVADWTLQRRRLEANRW